MSFNKDFICSELTRLIRLAIPVLVTQLIMMGMSVVDTIMAGHVSKIDLTAVALGSSLAMPVIFFCQGILFAVTPIIANHYGARRYRHIRRAMMQSLWLALMLSVIAWLVCTQIKRILPMMNNDQAVIKMAGQYIWFMSFGVFGGFLYQAWRGLNEGLGNTFVIMIFGVLGLLLNIPINYIFIHGLLGMPQLGGAGCGLATAIVFSFMGIGLGCYVYLCKRYKRLHLLRISPWPHWGRIISIFRLGFPIGCSLFFEISLFSAMTLIMSSLGNATVAAHQVALNIIGVIFMIPLSIGSTLTIRIGHLLGNRNPWDARRVALLGVGVGLLIAFMTSTLTFFFREQIIHLYTDDYDVVRIAMQLLIIGAAFQISDAMQVVMAGILRGYQDTRSIFWITLISYWPIGLGSGYLLGLTDYLTSEPLGARGFWIAFVIGLSCAAILLSMRFYRVSHQYEKWIIKGSQLQQSLRTDSVL